MKFRHQFAVFGFFFFVYMLGASREIPWNDARLIANSAESIVYRGVIGIPTTVPGVVTYAPHPILPIVSMVPGMMVYKWIVDRWLPAWTMAKALTSHLGSTFFGALTCLLFFNACLGLGVSRRVASFATILLGLGTFVCVYARSPYSEIVQAASVMGFIAALLAFWDRQDFRTALRVGFWGALMVNSKLVFALSLPGGLLICLFRLRFDLKRFAALAPWALAPLALGFFVLMKHNEARTGIATSTGYSVAPTIFAQPLWEGVWGLLVSPGRSVFLFAPPLVLSLFAMRTTWQRKPQLLWVLGLCLPPVFYLYAKYEAWSGDWGWGPRYMVPLVGPLLLPGALLISKIGKLQTKRLWLVPVMALSISGVFVQILGNSFYWDHFIRISQEARNGWLGNPNRTGSKGVPRGASCDPCFEDFYPFQWLPAFQQIEGHWWMLKNVPFKRLSNEATLSAPWMRYTTMVVPIDRSYRQARVDWWLLQFWTRFKTASIWLLAVSCSGTLMCAWSWFRANRLDRKLR